MTVDQMIERYLLALRKGLRGLPEKERNEIVSEIRAHIRESTLETGADVETVIAHLGTAKELAALYCDSALIGRTARAISPWLILHGAFRLARTSALGFLCFLLALTGYGGGLAMILSAAAKLFFPEQVGLWIGPGILNFGYHSAGDYQGGIGVILRTSGPAHEVLGWWYIPVALAMGLGLLAITTKLVRTLVKQIKITPKRFLGTRSALHAA